MSLALQLKEDQKEDAPRGFREYTVVDESAETLLTGPNSLYEAYEHHARWRGIPRQATRGLLFG